MAYTDVTSIANFPDALESGGGGVSVFEPEQQSRFPAKSPAGKLERWAKKANLTGEFDNDKLDKIGADVIRDYEIDEQSRSDWKAMHEDAFKLALQETSDRKSYPFPGAANVSVPVLIVAALQFNARAYPAIVDNPTLVKTKVNGSDKGVPVVDPATGQPVMQANENGEPEPVWAVKPGAKRERGDRISRHMSFQLLEEMEEWEESVDKELMQVPIVGCAFRKTYRDTTLKRNVSKLIPAMDLVVNDETTETLEDCPCITEVCTYYRHQVETHFRKKLWREIEIQWDEDEGHKKEEFLEQHCHMDLDEDGYDEPYIITVHKETQKVVRIVTCFEPEDIDAEGGRIVCIRKAQYYTKISFLPHPKGRFYDLGFGLLLRYLNKSINTVLNMLLDAGKLANMRGGFIGRGPDIRAEQMRIAPGEWKFVNVSGGDLRNAMVPLEYKEPSPVLYQLMTFLIEFANKITSVQDVLTGDVNPNIKPTTIIAQVEQATKQLRTIFKRILRGRKAEFKKLAHLNRTHLSDQEYFTFLDEADQSEVARSDYEDEDLDISPAADPRMVFDMQRMAQAEAIFGWGQSSPYANQEETNRQFVQTIGGDPELLMQKPQGNPELEMRVAELQLKGRAQDAKDLDAAIKRAKLWPEILEILARAEASASKAEADSAGIDLEQIRQWNAFVQQAHQMDMDLINAATAAMGQGQPANQPTGNGAMGGQSGDADSSGLLLGLRGAMQGGLDGLPAPRGAGPGPYPTEADVEAGYGASDGRTEI